MRTMLAFSSKNETESGEHLTVKNSVERRSLEHKTLLIRKKMLIITILLILALTATSTTFNFEVDGGAKANDDKWDTVLQNGKRLNESFASLKPGDSLLIPEGKTFYLMGGIVARNLTDVTIQIDGTLKFGSTLLDDIDKKYIDAWPRTGNGNDAGVLECISLYDSKNLTITGSGNGVLDGQGAKWWGLPGIGYLEREENRPRLLHLNGGKHILVEHIFLKDSPYWTFLADDVKHLEIRYSKIDAQRTSSKSHDILDLTAFNTDGFDVSGCDDVYIHDSSVFNQDDCFDVKDGTSNVVIERVNASGLGLTIGSISSTVNNITFRDSRMDKTYKGIYIKFRGEGQISNVLYENIVINEPTQWAVWIGPAQQCDGCSIKDMCSANPCSLCWPTTDPWAKCNAVKGGLFENITLRNITINNPSKSSGVLIADPAMPMKNLVFDNVVVNNPKTKPFKNYYVENAPGIALGSTSPVPPGFTDMTIKSQVRSLNLRSAGRVG